jgi:hypothetical protein
VPVKQQYDLVIGGKGFMLARGQFKGRAWRRTGAPNAVRPRITDADAQRNALQPEVDFVAAYEDFSGGFGDAYRNTLRPNRIHWSENFDSRFPQQLVHAQDPRTLKGAYNVSPSGGTVDTADIGAYWITQVPDVTSGAGRRPLTGGRGMILIYAQSGLGENDRTLVSYNPTGLAATGKEFDRIHEWGQVDLPFAAWYGRPALFGSFSWIPATPNNTFWRRSLTGGAGIAATKSVIQSAGFVTAGNRMWKASAPVSGHVQYVQSVDLGSDPMGTANWSATLSVGNGQVDVQDLVALDDQVYLGMQDGLYAGDLSGTFVNVLGDIAGNLHPDNGRYLSIHDGAVIYPYVGGLMQYRPSLDVAESRDIGPPVTSQRSPIRGRFRATHSYAGWLYGGYYTGSQSWVMAGRDRGNGEYQWHPLQRLPHPSMVRQVMVDGITTPSGGGLAASFNTQLPPRFWALTEWSCNTGAATSATSHIYWWPIPPNDTNPLGAPAFSANYCGSARIDFGRDNRGAPETLKVLRRLDVNTDASTFLSGARYADVYYILDGGQRSLLGRAQTSPRSTLFFPSGEGSFVTCYDFELSVESFTASLAHTPVYRSFVLHGAFLTKGTDEITAIVDLADGRADRFGTPMRPASVQLAELRGMAGGLPQSLIDLTGGQSWVTIHRGITEEETYQEGDDDPELVATIRMSEQAFSE